MGKLIFALLLICAFALLLVAVPATIGVVVGGDEATAWITATASAVIFLSASKMLNHPRG